MLWPWGREKQQRGGDDRLATLSRRLDDAESTLRTLRTEWLDTLDRFERIMGRLNKRASRAAEAAEVPPGEPTPFGAAPVSGPANGSEVARLVALRRSRTGPHQR